MTGGIDRKQGTAEIDKPTPVAKGDARAPSPTSQRIGLLCDDQQIACKCSSIS